MSSVARASIRDNNPVAPATLAQLPELAAVLTDRTLGQLKADDLFVFPAFDAVDSGDPNAADQQDLTADQKVLFTKQRQVWAGNVMGFIGKGDEQLMITSRFVRPGQRDHFFQYLLAKVLGTPNVVDLSTTGSAQRPLVDLLRYSFPLYLRRALRKGLYKTYIRREENEAAVRGPIDVARHLRQNTPFLGNVAYSRRELTADNHVLQLVQATIDMLVGQAGGRKLLASVSDEVALVREAVGGRHGDVRQLIHVNQQRPVMHAYYREYRDLQRLCLLLLQHRQIQLGLGTRQVYGILFDGAWLWEEYLNSLLSPAFMHPRNNSGKLKQFLFFDEETGRNKGSIFPDFIRDAPRVIVDAKYKPYGNIGGRDYQQMLAYLLRFESRHGYYLYPEQGARLEHPLLVRQGLDAVPDESGRPDPDAIQHEWDLDRIGLHIPQDCDDYPAFEAAMAQSEVQLKRRLGLPID
ncbi:5-methylcytosine restriction system specificity protein McrC [Lacticaseibacillus yichunensis]|uniref:5-methylcytosine-specific restriction endonuclease McrBC regulatory subunit McrC n=1 Tax=Lacticaseibacillus yichunensis TaxID=2486015 RepID=A0ABW4CMN1_9LACO|nr:hypothetical protein [Lacticaseibacillus yichunensis]